MKKITVVLILFLSFNHIAFSQNYEWTKALGSTHYDEIESIVTDQDGNVYNLGTFNGTVDFDPGPNNFVLTASNRDIFIQKLDMNGDFVWAISFEEELWDDANNITIDNDGNLIFTGSRNTYSAYSNIIIYKLDQQGNIIFQHEYDNYLGQNDSSNRGHSLVTDSMNNIYITGHFADIIDFDISASTSYVTPSGSFDVFILKLDTNGNFLWVKSIGGSGFDYSRSIAIDNLDNIYISGEFSNTVDFDPGTGVSNMTSNGGWDSFVVKLDNNGNLVWNARFGNYNTDTAQSITIDINNDIYVTGGFQGTVDFDPGVDTFNLTTNGANDIYILKLNGNGGFIWAKSMGGSSDDYGLGIQTDLNSNFYLTGIFQSTVDLNPDDPIEMYTSNGNYDTFIQKYDCEGNLSWTHAFGGIQSDRCESLTLDATGNIFAGGYFGDTVNFNPYDENNTDIHTSLQPPNLDFHDAFTIKFGQTEGVLTANSLNSLIECDDNDDGIYEYFDTSMIESTVLGNQSCLIVSYFDENGVELPSPLPNPFTNTVPYIQNITVRVSNALNPNIYDETILTLEVTTSLSVGQPIDLVACDEGNGYASFDTATIHEQLIGTQTGLDVLYFDQNGNPLPSPLPNPMTNTIANEEVITAQIFHTNNQECNSEITFSLIVESLPEISPIDDLLTCDDNNNGIASFDFTNLENEVIGNLTNVSVDYFDSNSDPLNPLPTSYTNIIPYQDFITARVIDNTNECYTDMVINLVVNPLPIANALTPLIACDDNNDGISEYFDTSQVEATVIGNQTNLVVSYYDASGNLLTSPLPNPFTNTTSFNQNITVRVTNTMTDCYNETTLALNTSSQPSINQPNDLYTCDEGNGMGNFDTSSIENELIGTQTGLTISYFDQDGNALPSPLPLLFQNTIPYTQTINVRVEDNSSSICYSETSFDLIVIDIPEIDLEENYYLCDLEPSLSLSIDDAFDSYSWIFEDGTLISNTHSATALDEGSYTVTISKFTNGISCENTFTFQLTRSELPTIQTVNFDQLGNSYIEIIAVGDGDFEYSIDGINYQDSNLFENVTGGTYTVYVRDKDGCGEDTSQVSFIDYPNFFTPNNDGYNDVWTINGIENYPDANIIIFDRFGKIIKELFDGQTWDGNYRGRRLPSSEYWFLARINPDIKFRGHFSLVR